MRPAHNATVNRSPSTVEPVCGTPKWKLENGAQRPAPETRPARTEKPKIAGQRLGGASLTRGNVADSHTPGNKTSGQMPMANQPLLAFLCQKARMSVEEIGNFGLDGLRQKLPRTTAKTSVSGSSNAPGSANLTILSWVTAYLPLMESGGSNTPTIRRLTSRRGASPGRGDGGQRGGVHQGAWSREGGRRR
jgi:hypothetical protein